MMKTLTDAKSNKKTKTGSDVRLQSSIFTHFNGDTMYYPQYTTNDESTFIAEEGGEMTHGD